MTTTALPPVVLVTLGIKSILATVIGAIAVGSLAFAEKVKSFSGRSRQKA